MSTNTKKSYRYSLWDFCKFISNKLNIKIDEKNKDVEIQKIVDVLYTKPSRDVEVFVGEYLKNLKDKGQSTSTISAKLAAVKDTFEIWNRWRDTKIDLSAIKPPKIEKRKIRGPKSEEFNQILEEINKRFEYGDYADKRDALIFYVMNFCGLRISEVLSVDIEPNLLKEGLVSVMRKGKQSVKTEISVPPFTKEKIEQFLLNDERKKGPLFINIRDKTRLSRESAWRSLTKLTEEVVGRKISPHKFRHFYATEAWKLTKNKDLAMKFTGHKSREVFDRYEEDEENHAGNIGKAIEDKWVKK